MIARRGLEEEKKLTYRAEHSKPVVEAFFVWLEEQLHAQALLPTNPFTKAAAYALERKAGLRVFLSHPDLLVRAGCEIYRHRSEPASAPASSTTLVPTPISSMCFNALTRIGCAK